ncbi:MAG: PD-(D/E)XK nuclease family protein [Flavobacteriales bacterium]|nr:PD-(D/E)XK nuclease family protein [Flavobacteriales bacterium]
MSGSFPSSILLNNVAQWLGRQSEETALVLVPNRRMRSLMLSEFSAQLQGKKLEVFTVPEFLRGISGLNSIHVLALLNHLYEIQCSLWEEAEPFVRFMPFGLRLLQDFDEIDNHVLDPEALFLNLENYHRYDWRHSDYPESVVRIVCKFWEEFGQRRHEKGREKFLHTWRTLLPMYQKLRTKALQNGQAWDGLAVRLGLQEEEKLARQTENCAVAFAGFSLATRGEEMLMEKLKRGRNTAFFYDADPWFIRPVEFLNEAPAEPLRRLIRKFPPFSQASGSLHAPKKIILHSCLGSEAQARKAAELASTCPAPILLVSPTEETMRRLMRMPSLQNGFYSSGLAALEPFDFSGFFQTLFKLFSKYTANPRSGFHIGDLLNLLEHPVASKYSQALHQLGHRVREACAHQKNPPVYVRPEALMAQWPELEIVAGPVMEATNQAGMSFFEVAQKVFLGLQPLGEVQELFQSVAEIWQYLADFRVKLAEPKQALQVLQLWLQMQPLRMPTQDGYSLGFVTGLLDSRALDFKTVVFTDFGEGIFPDYKGPSSFIPVSLRQAFGLPWARTYFSEQIYLFFRLFQSAQEVHLLYHGGDKRGMASMPSLLLHQMKAEFPGWTYEDKPKESLRPLTQKSLEISVEKEGPVYAALKRYMTEQEGLSPSALITYLDCPLKFYFRHIARLREPDPGGVWTPAAYGTLLHNIMEDLYRPYTGRTITSEKLKDLERDLESCILAAISTVEIGSPQKDYALKGKNILLKEALLRSVKSILTYDATRTPFTLLHTEWKKVQILSVSDGHSGTTSEVKLKGKVDRVDERMGAIHILDYKTGRELWSQFNPIFLENIFENYHRARYDIQLMFYAWLARDVLRTGQPMYLEVVAVRTLGAYGKESFSKVFSNHTENDVTSFFGPWKDALTQVVKDILDPGIPFYQTQDKQKCQVCFFRKICKR